MLSAILSLVLAVAAAPVAQEPDCSYPVANGTIRFWLYSYQLGDRYITDTIQADSFSCAAIQKTARNTTGGWRAWGESFSIHNTGAGIDLEFTPGCYSSHIAQASGGSNGTAVCGVWRDGNERQCVLNGVPVSINAWKGCTGDIPYENLGEADCAFSTWGCPDAPVFG